MNLHRLAPDAESYYLDRSCRVSRTTTPRTGESPGYWLASSHLHGLDGVVDGDDLRAVLSGARSRDRRAAASGRNRKGARLGPDVPGAEVGVDPLGGSGAAVARMVADAHDAAVDRAVAYMEEVAAFTRTGATNAPGSGGRFIAARFRHRTSGDRDPLLHTHVLVASSLRTADGRWRTIDATALYDHARTAGYLYQAHLRNETPDRTDRRGLDADPRRTGRHRWHRRGG
ncbi:MAG: relaxase domain-containing protein [Microthrixaceae bacterium]|nr:relaxase domain-containing protein [Microthrixaceae bacterium]